MKNYSRAYNRYMKHVKFMKRVKKWFSGADENGVRQYYLDLTMQGKHHTFLRTTSHPCSCFCCKNLKDERVPRYKVIEDAFKLEE